MSFMMHRVLFQSLHEGYLAFSHATYVLKKLEDALLILYDTQPLLTILIIPRHLHNFPYLLLIHVLKITHVHVPAGANDAFNHVLEDGKLVSVGGGMHLLNGVLALSVAVE